MSQIFQIKEAYKNFSKGLAIAVMRQKYGVGDAKTQPPDDINSIVILAQERYGDIIVMTPLIRLLRNAFPKLKLTVLGVTDIVQFLSYDKNIDHVYDIKHAARDVQKHIFSQIFDVLFNPKDHPSFTYIKLSGKLNAKYKIGMYHERHRAFFHTLFEHRDDAPTVQKNLMLADYLQLKPKPADWRPYMPDGPVSEAVNKFAGQLNGHVITGINLSASNRSKEWGVERWSEFIAGINDNIVLISTAAQTENKLKLEQRFDHIIPAPPTETIFDVAHLVRQFRILVTTDTSLVHIASCFNTPIVALYRLERDLNKFKPLSDLQRIHVTPSGVIDDIEPQTVIQSYFDLAVDLPPATSENAS